MGCDQRHTVSLASQIPTSAFPSAVPPNQAAMSPDPVSTIVEAWHWAKGAWVKMSSLRTTGGRDSEPFRHPKEPRAKRIAPAAIRGMAEGPLREGRDIVPGSDDDRREDEDDDAGHDEPARRSRRALPLMEKDPPEAAEGDDEGHVDGPARKVVFPHLGRAHAVEEELEIPCRSGEGRPDIVREKRRPARGWGPGEGIGLRCGIGGDGGGGRF